MMENLNLQENEDKLITIALSFTNGNKGQTARLLGIPERTLYRKIQNRRNKDKE